MLSDIVQLKTFLSIPLDDTSQDGTLGQLLGAADAAVKRYCKRLLETQVIVEYPLLRNGGEALTLEQTPVLSYRLTGNIQNGQPTITGLSSTSNLIAGMPVLQAIGSNGPATQPFPNGVTILSIDSATQVTLTGNATATQTGVPFIFGLALWYDPQGSYGDGIGSDPTGPFGETSLLRAGLDYALQRDQPDGSSKSGKLTRLASAFGFLGMAGDWGSFGSAWGGLQSRGTLSGPLKPLWPSFPPGSVKAVYAAGLGQGSGAGTLLPSNTTIPADLTSAVNAVAAWMFNNADTGLVQIQSENFQGYGSSLAQALDALKSEGELGTTRQTLSHFRKVTI